MGAANKVPGVSGGVVAFVLGFMKSLLVHFKSLMVKHYGYYLMGVLKASGRI